MSPPTSRALAACAQAPSQTHNPPVSDETSTDFPEATNQRQPPWRNCHRASNSVPERIVPLGLAARRDKLDDSESNRFGRGAIDKCLRAGLEPAR